MGAIYDTLLGLADSHDDEMVEGIRRYESVLEQVLTPEQMEAYAGWIRQAGILRIFDEMTADEKSVLTPEQRAIAMAVQTHLDANMENRRVAALLNQRGQHEVAPDLDQIRGNN